VPERAPVRTSTRAHPIRYTEVERDIIRRMYNRHPPDAVQRAILRATGVLRATGSIRSEAQRLGVNGDRIPHGYVRLVDAHDQFHGTHYSSSRAIVRAARADGVLRKAHHVTHRPLIAPKAWVDAWLAQHYSVPTPDGTPEADVIDWLPTPEVARRLGTDPMHTADRLLRTPGRLRTLAKGARHTRLKHRRGAPRVWHPDDVDRIVAAWHDATTA
jgi:hypothetical protein